MPQSSRSIRTPWSPPHIPDHGFGPRRESTSPGFRPREQDGGHRTPFLRTRQARSPGRLELYRDGLGSGASPGSMPTSTSNLVLFGDEKEPRQGNCVLSQGLGQLCGVGTTCPAPWGGSRCQSSGLVPLLCWAKLRDRISSVLSFSRLSQWPNHPGEGPGLGLLGIRPKAFSLVPLGKDPEKD